MDGLSKSSSALTTPAEAGPEGLPKRPQLPEWQRVPSSDADLEFQKNLSEELVFAWQDAASPDVQVGLERSLFNVGVERRGMPGEVLEFDGSWQHSDDDIAEGDAVEVILPGWQLSNARGTFLLARAKVKRASGSPAVKDGTKEEVANLTEQRAPNNQLAVRTDEEPAHHQAEEPTPPTAPTAHGDGGAALSSP